MDDEGKRAASGRRVYVSGKALVETYDGDGNVLSSETVHRNIHSVIGYLKGLEPQTVCGIYLVEDEDSSDPPADGESRMRAPLLPEVPDRDGNMQRSSERIEVAEAITRLVDAMQSSREVLAQFHDMFDRASAASDFEGGVLTLVFDGRPAGFAFVNSCRPVKASSLGTMYEAAKSQVEQLKENLRRMAPGMRFSDDPDDPEDPDGGSGAMYLPDGSIAGSDRRVVTPAEAAREAEERGLTRIVRVVD